MVRVEMVISSILDCDQFLRIVSERSGGKNFKKSSLEIWRSKNKVVIFAPAFGAASDRETNNPCSLNPESWNEVLRKKVLKKMRKVLERIDIKCYLCVRFLL